VRLQRVLVLALGLPLLLIALFTGSLELLYHWALTLAPVPPKPEALHRLPTVVSDSVWVAEFGSYYTLERRMVNRTIHPIIPAARIVLLPRGATDLATTAARFGPLPDTSRHGAWRRYLAVAARTIWISRHYTADEAVAYVAANLDFGFGLGDITTASDRLFGKPLDALGPTDAAVLLGVAQLLPRFDPWCHPRAAIARRNHLLGRLSEIGTVPCEELATLSAAPLNIEPADPGRTCSP